MLVFLSYYRITTIENYLSEVLIDSKDASLEDAKISKDTKPLEMKGLKQNDTLHF